MQRGEAGSDVPGDAAAAALDALPDGVLFVDRAGVIRYANPAARQILRPSWELVGGPVPSRTWQARDLDGEIVVESPVLATLRDGAPRVRVPVMLTRADGSTLWVELSSAVIARDAGGAPTLASSTFTDITEPRARDLALRAAEARYHALFDNLTSAFALHEVVTDDAGAVVDYVWLEVNPAYERLIGLPAATLIGRSVRGVLPGTPEEWADRLGKLGRVALAGESLFHEDFVERSGRWFENWAFRPAPRQVATLVTETTERHRIADAIAASEARYRDLAETSVDMITRHDALGRVSYASPAALTVLGRPPEAMIGLPALTFIAPADHVRVGAAIAELLHSRTPTQLQYRVVMPDGELRWVESAGRSVVTARGAIELMISTRDISSQKKLTEIVGEVDAFNKALFSTVGALVIVLDRHAKIVLFNPACEQLTGWRATEIVGQSFVELLVPPEQRAGVREVFANLAAGMFPIRYENDWLTRAGDRRWIAWANSAVVDETGEVKYVFGTGIDRTAERRAEVALREVVSASASHVGARFFAELVQSLARAFDVRHAVLVGLEGDTATILASTGPLAAPLPSPPTEADFAAALGAAHALVVPVLDDEGAPLALLTLAGDRPLAADPLIRDVVTLAAERARAELERGAAERAMRRLNAELERRVSDRTAELAATNRELEAFSYSVSHDLRAPLRAIDGFSRIIEEDHGAALPEDARRVFGRIRAASQRLARLIDDLLTLSRSARADLHRAAIDVTALAHDIVDGLRRAEPARLVDVAIAPDLTINADPALARTVLENLLGNAWKYTARVARAHIALAAGPAPGTLVLGDDGAGFDMAYAGKLFGAFQRLHGTAEFPGNGIGLATTRRILARHGGTISAHGEVGRGATFTFAFGPGPTTEAPAEPAPIAAEPPPPRGTLASP